MKAAPLAFAALIAGLLAGVLLGMNLASSPETERLPEVSVGRAATVPAPLDAEPNAVELEPVASQPAKAGAGAPLDSRAAGQAAAALARVKVPSLGADWTGIVSGRVVNAEGEAIEGADVVCQNRASDTQSRWSRNDGKPWTGLSSVEESVNSSARRAIVARQRLRHVKAAADGAFRLERLDSGSRRIEAYAEGFSFTAVDAKPGETATLVGERIYSYELDVRLPDGTQPASAQAGFTYSTGSGSTGSSRTWYPDDPVLRLPYPRLTFRISTGKGPQGGRTLPVPEYKADPVEIEAGKVAGVTTRIELIATRGLVVTVTGNRERLRGEDIQVKIAEGSVGEGFGWDDFSVPRLRRRFAAANSKSLGFHVIDLVPGLYTLGVLEKGALGVLTRQVEVTEGWADIEVALGARDLGEVLVVAVATSTGEPVTDARVSASHATNRQGMNGVYGSSVSLPGDNPGEWILPWHGIIEARGFVAGDSVQLTATSPTCGKVTARVRTKAPRFEMIMQPSVSVEVTVAAESPRSFDVQLWQLSEGDLATGSPQVKKPGTGGSVLFDALQPGRYRVAIQRAVAGGRRLYLRDSIDLAQEVIEVRSKGTAVALTPAATHELVVSAPDLEEGARFTIKPSNESRSRERLEAQLDGEGQAVFRGVPTGRYILSGGNSRSPGMIIQVPCGEVVFDPPPLDSLRVSSVEAGGIADLAGLRDGDFVIAISGEPIEGMANLRRLQMQLMSGPTKLTVARGRSEVELEFPSLTDEKGNQVDPGIRLEPAARGQ